MLGKSWRWAPCFQILILFLLAAQPALGQEEPKEERPKIGLVLSGGGARGATHVGVLKALEELHVPIDYIAGTSMGSIVGALYATGKSPEEIENLLTTADWETIFTDKPPRRDLSFRKKQDDKRYLGTEAGIDRKGIKTGLGLIVGQHLNVFLESLTLTAGKTEDFTKFPIPFGCVATDIITGEKVILKEGHLATALRASMSIPGVFTPVDWNGRLLVDGGLTDNLPVDVVREMGADIVIAVDISTPPMTRDELTSFMAVSSQMTRILMSKNLQESAKQADIFIKPDLKGFSNMDFVDAASLVPIGRDATASRAAELAKYAVKEEEHRAILARIRSSQPSLPDKLGFVKFEGTDEKSLSLIKGKTSSKIGEPLDPEKVSRDLDRLFSIGDFQSVTYRLTEEGGEDGLVVSATPSPLGPNRLRFGMLLSTDFSNQSNWAFLAQFKRIRINESGAEWKNDLEIGLNRRLYTEFYQPLGFNSRWFAAPYVEYYNIRQDIYDQKEAAASYRSIQGTAGIDVGFSISKYGEMRLGLAAGKGKYENIVGTDLFSKYGLAGSADIAGVRFRLTLDHLDSADFPTQGYLVDIDSMAALDTLGADDEFRKAELEYEAYATQGKNTLLTGLSAGTSFGSDLPPYSFFQAGGFDKFAGYDKGQLYGRYYGVFRLGYSRVVSELPLMVGKGVHVSVFGDIGNVWMNSGGISWDGILYSGTIDAATDTRIGPIHLAYCRTSDGNDMLIFYLGKRF